MNQKNNTFSCLAVDMGAGSIRIMLGMIDNQEIKYNEVFRFNNTIKEIDGHDRWDIQEIFEGIVRGINRAIAEAKVKPGSIGVDSWGVDFVLLDDNGEPLDTPVSYRDSRTDGMMEQWKKNLSAIETFKKTGINFYVFNTLFQLLSLRGSALIKQTRKILFIPSYVSYRLTGNAKNEQTIASTSQILGIDGVNWDLDILNKLGINEKTLGSVVPPGTKLGTLSSKEITDNSIEVIAVSQHDTACAIAAIPSTQSNFAFISTGTWCILGHEASEANISPRALDMGFTNERSYNNTFRTLKNIVGLWLIQGLKKEYPEDTTFSDLERIVNESEPTHQFIDTDDPVFFNPDNMKAAFDTFFNKSGQAIPEQQSDYLRIAYDSLCFAFRYNLEYLEESRGKAFDRIHVIGGGCQSDFFNQRISTICKKEVIAGPVEGSVMGNILIQAIATGKLNSLDEGRNLLRNSIEVKKYAPAKGVTEYDSVYKNYLVSVHKVR